MIGILLKVEIEGIEIMEIVQSHLHHMGGLPILHQGEHSLPI